MQQPVVITWQTNTPVYSIAFSADGSLLASYEQTDELNTPFYGIRVRRVSDGQLVASLPQPRRTSGHQSSIESIAWSPDGVLLAEGSFDDNNVAIVRLWNVADEQVLTTWSIPSGDRAWTIQFSSDAQRLLIGISHPNQTRLIYQLRSIPTGQLITTINHERAFFTSNDEIMVADLDRFAQHITLRLWPAETIVSTIQDPDGYSFRSVTEDTLVAMSCNTGLSDQGCIGMRLYNTQTGHMIATLNGHTADIRAVAFSPDHTTLASASGSQQGWIWRTTDRTIRLWRVGDGKQLRVFNAHKQSIPSLAFSPDGHYLASGSYDGTIRLWTIP